MKASREVRRWINRLRKWAGRKNGVVYGGLFDDYRMERKQAKSDKQHSRAASRRDALTRPLE